MRVKSKRKFAFLSLLISLFVLSFVVLVPRSLSVKAEEDKKYTISGSVYCQSGNSDFWLVKGNLYAKVRLLDVYGNFVAESKINEFGQYFLSFSGSYSVHSLFYFDIVSYGGVVSYLFNNFTNDYNLSGLVSGEVAYVDLYSQLYFFTQNLQSPISNSLPSIIDISGINGQVSSQFKFIDSSLDYFNNFTFDFYLDFTSRIPGPEVPAVWFNANGTSKSWLFGCGVYAVYTTSTDKYPWSVYFKDNKTGYSILLYQLNDSNISNLPKLHFRYNVTLVNDLPVLSIFYDLNDSTYSLQNFTLLYKKSYNEKIGSFQLQSFNCNASLQYSYTLNNLSHVSKDYSTIYDNGYSAGKIDGERIGYSLGFADGSKSDYSFNSLLTAIFDVPVKTVTKLFNVEILGVNLSDFVLSIATVFIVIALVKFFLGIFVGGD